MQAKKGSSNGAKQITKKNNENKYL